MGVGQLSPSWEPQRPHHFALFFFLLIAAFWHVALILVEEGRRLAYLAYAILFMPALFFISLVAGMAATNTWSTV
jgi:hypothetical protein